MVERFTSGRRQFNLYNFFIILAVSFGSMSYGYASSAIAPVLALPEFLEYFELETRGNGEFDQYIQSQGWMDMGLR